MKEPKEKARELVDDYLFLVKGTDFADAIQCALICVDEIIEAELNVLIKFNIVTESYVPKYWNSVKEHLKQM